MAKDSNSKCKLCRRAGEKLFLKGDRCLTPKCAVTRKPYVPGMHGPKGQRGLSEFGKQLAEKQKLKRLYGLSERQLRRHLGNAQKQKGVVGDNLILELESRFDNIIYRLGIASSRAQARQLVSHSMFTVGDKVLNVPSAKIKVGQEIQVKEGKMEKTYMKELRSIMKKKQETPSWLSLDPKNMQAKVLSKPTKEEAISDVDLAAVLEFYSR